MKKTFPAWILALVLLLAVASAHAAPPAEDRAGNPVTIPESVQTIASLAPSITQMIVDLGQGDKLVAVDTYSKDIQGVPDEALAFDIMSPEAEQLVALSPDVVFVSGMSLSVGTDPFKTLTDLGICVLYIPSSSSIDAIVEDTLFIGEALGDREGAQALCDRLTGAVEAFRASTDVPVRVYFEIQPFPNLYSFGSGTFLNEMIELLGGENIFADQQSWIAVSEESVVARNPEIIFTNVSWTEDAVGEILSRTGWESVDAVQNKAVYPIDADASSQPNHRIVLALEEMAQALQK